MRAATQVRGELLAQLLLKGRDNNGSRPPKTRQQAGFTAVPLTGSFTFHLSLNEPPIHSPIG